MTKKQMISWLTNESSYYEAKYDELPTWSIAQLRNAVADQEEINAIMFEEKGGL